MGENTEETDSTANTRVDDNTDTSPLYLLFSTIDGPDSRTGYFVTTPSINGDVPVDVRQGLEEAGGGVLFAEPGIGTFLLAGGESPTLSRWDVSNSGSLVRGKTLSFANQGVTTMFDRWLIFASPTKAYFRDRTQLQLISFNPTSMEILDSHPLEGVRFEDRDGLIYNYGTPITRDDAIYFPMSYFDLNNKGVGPTGSTLIRLDPETDELTVTKHPGCTGMTFGFLSPDSGDTYWFADYQTSVGRAYQQLEAPHDCAMRLRAGKTDFDEDSEIDLSAFTDGAPVIGAVPAGGAKMWMKVFDESAVSVSLPSSDLDEDNAFDARVWRWHLLDMESEEPAVPVEGADRVGSFGYSFVVDNRSFTTQKYDEAGEAAIVEFTDQGIVERVRVLGEIRGLARLQ